MVSGRKMAAFIILMVCLGLSFPVPEGAAFKEEIDRNTGVKEGSVQGGVEKSPFRVVVLPVENLSGIPVPLKEIRLSLAEGLKRRGFAVLAERNLESFMKKHRMRYTGGITRELSLAFLGETGADAVLITSLEFISDGPPPKFSFFARLVSTGEQATILWTKSVGMSGDDHPGILGLGLILTSGELRRKAVDFALDSLAQSVPEGMPRVAVRSVSGGKFPPKRYHRSQGLKFRSGRPVTVAVLPFLNIGMRKYAGSLMELHFVSRLAQVENVRVIEPGVVREVLLQQRVIMQEGVSGPQADLLFSMLDVDLLLSGSVSEYQDAELPGGSSVGFSVLAFDGKSRKVVWSSRSHNRGNDGVFFFNLGEVETAAAMASQMVWSVVERMIAGNG